MGLAAPAHSDLTEAKQPTVEQRQVVQTGRFIRVAPGPHYLQLLTVVNSPADVEPPESYSEEVILGKG